MTESEWQRESDISLFAMGTTLVRHRWRIARWMVFGGLIALIPVISKQPLYLGSASFVTQNADAGRSGLASLAGQLGVSIPTGNQSLSLDFYSQLLKSRVLLLPLVRDTLIVSELAGKRAQFADLFDIPPGPTERREEQALRALRDMVDVHNDKTTGVIAIAVATPWRSVSLALTTAIVSGVNAFNDRMRQSQAGAERVFVEGRLAIAGADLAEAEGRLQRFLATNRDIGGSPQLSLERDRIQRDLSLRQQLFLSLKQSYEEARLREVRDTPVITIFEPPSVPTGPEGRGRLKRTAIGVILGALLAVILTIGTEAMAHHRKQPTPEAKEFFASLSEIKRELLRPFRWMKRSGSA